MTDDKEWHTVTELAERLGIPDATLRRYIRNHGVHLKTKKRHKSYLVAEGSLPELLKIRESYAAGMSVDAVEEALVASGAPMTITVTDATDDGESVTMTIGEAFSGMTRAMTDLRDRADRQEEFNRELLQRLDEQRQYIEETLKRRDEALMTALREISETKRLAAADQQQEQEQPRRKWWFGRR